MEKNYMSLILEIIGVGIIAIAILMLFTSMQDDAPSVPHYDPTSTPTPTSAEEIAIVFVDDVPVAVMTCTNTPTPKPTNTPTMPPTPTERPQERIATPKPTNTPKPDKKAQIVPYPTGTVGTQYVDSPDAHTWKPYARYWKVTKKGSVEYKLRCMETTAENGLRVVADPNGVERYCIALCPQWAGGQAVDIGRCIDIKMANGAILHCVLADVKTHEKSYKQEGRYGSRGELIEFIVDETKLPKGVHGDISNVSKEFEGGAVSVTVLDLYIDGFGG